jgi:hypothetical protein
MKAIQGSCNDTPTIRFNFLDIEDCARRTGLKTAPSDAHSENLFLHLLRNDPPRIQFANDDQRHSYHLGQIRSALHVVGALALAGCLLYSGKLLYETHEVTQESQALRAESTMARQRYADIVKTFPPIPTNTETLRQVIDRYVEIDRKTASPIGLYRELSRALQAAPAAELDALEWRVGGIDAAAGQPTNSTYAATAVPDDSETLIVRGTLKTGASTNARQTLAAFNRLIDALKANTKLQVVVLQSPFDIESGKSLKGSDTGEDDNQPRAFSLQIVRKLQS